VAEPKRRFAILYSQLVTAEPNATADESLTLYRAINNR
jgi:hypothetical protein